MPSAFLSPVAFRNTGRSMGKRGAFVPAVFPGPWHRWGSTLTARTRQFVREVSVALVASGVISVVGFAVTLYVASQLQAQTMAGQAEALSDHESRLRVIEGHAASTKADVEWIKNFLQRRFP